MNAEFVSLHFAGQNVCNVEKQVSLETPEIRHLHDGGKNPCNQLETVFFHGLHGDVVGSFQHLQDILSVYVLLQPSLAVPMQLEVAESKEIGSRKDVEAVGRWHVYISIVGELEERGEGLEGREGFTEHHFDSTILGHEGTKESLEIRAACSEDWNVGGDSMCVDL